jgi:hypothetical protein
LRDTNPLGTLCTCPFKETFNFYIADPGKLKVSFYFKQYDPKDYHIEADTTIYLN